MPLVDKKSKYFTHYIIIYIIQISLENRVPPILYENIWGWIEWWCNIKPLKITSFVILLTKYYQASHDTSICTAFMVALTI